MIHLTPATRVLIFAGTSVYAFEGIALVIPIRESMEKPEYFPHMLVAWMMLSRPRYSWIGSIAAPPATMDGNILESTSDNRTVDLPGIRWISDKNRWHKRRKTRREPPTVSRISASVFVVCPCVRSLGTPKIHHNPPSIPSIWEIELPTDTFWAGIASSTTQVAGKIAEPLYS